MLTVLFLSITIGPRFPYLAREINSMAKVDQDVRFQLIDEMSKKKKPSMATMNRLRDIDHKDTTRMHWIVEKFGWPTPEMVGQEASDNAWLLVQHADDDKPFQKTCLGLIEPLARSGVIKGSNYAYLYDRVQTGQGKLQRFGTQGQSKDGFMWINPVENPSRLDAYRNAYGLTPIDEYAKTLSDAYHEPLAPNWRDGLKPPKVTKASRH